MTTEASNPIEARLAAMTRWDGPLPQVWRRALETARPPAASGLSGFSRVLNSRVATPVAACIAIVALGATVFLNLPHLQAQRYQNVNAAAWELARGEAVAGGIGDVPPLMSLSDATVTDATFRGRLDAVAPGFFGLGGGRGFRPQSLATDGKVGLPARHVVRKATMELVAADVRAAFVKAAHLIQEAGGEYVQESSLTGSGVGAKAELTLRVAADRLSSVLNELREFGEVRSEKTAGQDVTAQVVDIEARLRNEQRFEVEMLQLLEKRDDAPLKEILELRRQIGAVRQTIEQLTAQRERLGRLVSLATVLVIIRPADAPVEEPKSGIGAYFGDSISRAWSRGLYFLSDTVAGLLSVLLGGLMWWVALIAALLVIRRYVRRAQANTAGGA